MSRFKDLAKNGWHPEKSSSSSGSGSKTGIRGQVSGLMGRGKGSDDDRSNHVARPLSDLKDPASFAPPPKRTGAGLEPAPKPVSTPRKVVPSQSKYQDPRAPPVEPPSGQKQIEAPPEEEEAPPPSGPYRVNTTGLRTDHLPLPPGRRDGADGRNPPSYDDATSRATPKALPPSLPPRLPPRSSGSPQNSQQKTTAPPVHGNGLLNEVATHRLGAAGVSVPALGINRNSSPSNNNNTGSPSPPPVASAHSTAGTTSGGGGWGAQVNELQGRFSKMKTSSPQQAESHEPHAPSQGTTWAQKQAALKTASSFQKDPSSVSFADAKTAASTANNFRQRHGDQVAAGVKSANNFNQKYGVMDKVNAHTAAQGQHPQQTPAGHDTADQAAARPSVPGLAGKKKPPPPPKKKPGLAAVAVNTAQDQDSEPPPIPMSTRPTF